MSLHEYQLSRKIECEDYPFYALIMAAMSQADSDNIVLLRSAFPKVWEELNLRCNAPRGELSEHLEESFDRTGQLRVVEYDPATDPVDSGNDSESG